MSGVLSTTAGRRTDGIPNQLIEMFRAVFVDNSMGFEDVDLLMRNQTLVSGQPIENGCRVHIVQAHLQLQDRQLPLQMRRPAIFFALS